MEQREFRRNAADMIYLTACAVNNKKPKQERIDKLDLSALFEVCQKHILTACVAYALESAGIKDHEFTQAKEKAIRKNILLDAERRKILKRLEEEKIWYMPLKGALLKDWYPNLGMRQMSDNDILIDPAGRKTVRSIMEEFGFKLKGGASNVDEYSKEPVYNFEMHEALFPERNSYQAFTLYNYYKDIDTKLIRSDSGYGRSFSKEDFYLYMIVHEYKHYSLGGTGVRSLVDIYVFIRKFNNVLDWDYIERELKKLDVAEFEHESRQLAMKLLALKPLSYEEKKLLNFYVIAEAYGKYTLYVDKKVKKYGGNSKAKYILYRFFPPLEHYKVWYPWAYKHKWLIPAAWIFRVVKGLTVRRNLLKTEFTHLKK